jgi:hypothetical protein
MSLKRARGGDEEFQEVELAPHPNAGSHFFLEHTPFWSLVTTLAMLSAFIGMHTYAALRSPRALANKDEFFKLNSTEENVSFEVEITLSQLQEGHRFVAVNGSLIRNKTDADTTLPIELTVRKTLMKNHSVISNVSDNKRKYTLHWESGSSRSSLFDVTHVPVRGIDAIHLKMTIQADYTGVAGFQFHWDFANPSAEKYSKSARLLMSFLIGYMVLVFAFYLKFDAEAFTQIFLLLVGITGIFASDPLTYFLNSKAAGLRISDHILTSVFTAVFRLFLVLELEMLRARSSVPKPIVTILFGIFFVFYATVDAAASYDRQAHISQSESEVPVILQTETALMIFDAMYVVFSTVYLVLAVIQNDGVNSRRIGFFSFAVLTTSGVTVLTHIVFVILNTRMYSVMPPILFCSIHITVASMCIFLLHYGGGPEYREMNTKDDQGPMVIDVVAQSDDEGDEDDEEDEDEDEKKE